VKLTNEFYLRLGPKRLHNAHLLGGGFAAIVEILVEADPLRLPHEAARYDQFYGHIAGELW
jgi:hypothetical protein